MAKKKRTKQKKQEETKEEKSLRQELVSRMLTLATSGFGFVSALAWNDLVKKLVEDYVQPRVPGSGVAYQFLYAIIITILAVIITYQLSKLLARIDNPKK